MIVPSNPTLQRTRQKQPAAEWQRVSQTDRPMCYFVTIGVAGKDGLLVEGLGSGREGFGIGRFSNPSVVRLFPPTDVLFTITHGGCSCDIYAAPLARNTDEDEAADRERYRRKGWSEAKISRALEAKRSRAGRAQAHECRERFQAAISDLVRKIGHVRLLAHMYSGRIDDEEVVSHARMTIPLSEFEHQGGAFASDSIVEVVHRAGQQAVAADEGPPTSARRSTQIAAPGAHEQVSGRARRPLNGTLDGTKRPFAAEPQDVRLPRDVSCSSNGIRRRRMRTKPPTECRSSKPQRYSTTIYRLRA
jgi:hypothetical protein